MCACMQVVLQRQHRPAGAERAVHNRRPGRECQLGRGTPGSAGPQHFQHGWDGSSGGLLLQPGRQISSLLHLLVSPSAMSDRAGSLTVLSPKGLLPDSNSKQNPWGAPCSVFLLDLLTHPGLGCTQPAHVQWLMRPQHAFGERNLQRGWRNKESAPTEMLCTTSEQLALCSGGSDWQKIMIKQINPDGSSTMLNDTLGNVKFSNTAWAPDSKVPHHPDTFLGLMVDTSALGRLARRPGQVHAPASRQYFMKRIIRPPVVRPCLSQTASGVVTHKHHNDVLCSSCCSRAGMYSGASLSY